MQKQWQFGREKSQFFLKDYSGSLGWKYSGTILAHTHTEKFNHLGHQPTTISING